MSIIIPSTPWSSSSLLKSHSHVYQLLLHSAPLRIPEFVRPNFTRMDMKFQFKFIKERCSQKYCNKKEITADKIKNSVNGNQNYETCSGCSYLPLKPVNLHFVVFENT
jgi:hypothetical protein